MADYTLSAKITGDASGFTKAFGAAEEKLKGLSDKVKGIGKNISGFGSSLSSVGDKLTSGITTPAVAAASALTGITLVKGFNRLTGIDNAQAKLKGLGHDAKSVEEIMNSALESVKGTSFGMDEAATTAASAVAAGIKPGKDLTRYLSLTGDAAAIAGSSMAEMGSIINQVQTSQVAYTDNLNQLADRGIPIYQWLADEAGVAASEVKDMASDGKISSEMFLAAIEKNIGGAAKTMGESSFTAAISNIGASISRIGANFLDAGGEAGGFFSTVKPLLTDFNNSLGVVEEKAAELGVKFGQAFNDFLDKASELKSKFDGLSPSMQGIILKTAAIGTAIAVGIGPALKIIGTLTTGFGGLVSILGFLLSPIGLIMTAIVGLAAIFGYQMATNEEFRSSFITTFENIREKVTSIVDTVISKVQSIWSTIQPVLSTVASTLSTAFSNAVPVIQSAFSNLGPQVVTVFQTIWSIIQSVIPVITTFVTSIVEGFNAAGGAGSEFGLQLLNIFIGLNPIIKGAILLFQNFGPQIIAAFQQIATMLIPIVTTIGTAIGQIASAVIPIFMSVLASLIPIVTQVGTMLMTTLGTIIPIITNLFNNLVPIIMMVVQQIAQILAVVIPLVANLIGALIPAISMLIQGIMNIVTAVAPAFIAIIQAIGAAIQLILPIISSILQTVIHVITNIISVVTPIIGFIVGVISTIIGIIAPIVTFIAGVMTSIFALIRPIVTVVTGVFDTVTQVISSVWQGVMRFTGQVFTSIGTVISGLSGVVSGVFNAISGTVSRVMNGVSSTITGVFSAIQGAWSGLTGFVDGVFGGISTSVQKLVGQVKGFVNGVIGGVNSAIGIINKIPGVSIGKIPMLARGTDNFGGGFARINEGGRGELVMMPSGAQVIPHDVSMKYARESAKAAGTRETRPSGENMASSLRNALEGLIIDNRISIGEKEFIQATGKPMMRYIDSQTKDAGRRGGHRR
ncbi:hypothetical protein CWR48_15735 [Oceanobacillus arenosus]|uniref:Tape measure protein N-terminal domain-containing protein n=1 Tax=Oceanobacillus arenosus TaxID=1229153 RepID=A0A3D8PLU1_9BACI|nr:tape measure protein [Oceanobacillus arenosus]RDW17050.1 hypothetical protein CWR48_15735 [Oceanobacillus arenosus]